MGGKKGLPASASAIADAAVVVDDRPRVSEFHIEVEAVPD